MTRQTPDESQFKLEKVTLPKNGGAKIEFSYQKSVRNETHTIHDKHETTENPHPDLTGIMRKLKDYLVVVHNLHMVEKVVKRKQFDATTAQQKIATGALDEIKQAIRISQCSLHGSSEDRAVIITGVNTSLTGQGMALNTHKIHLENDTYGFESELAEAVDDLISECYEFVFNHKVEEPDLFENSMADESENKD